MSAGVADRLVALGFSTYEARAYVGLLAGGPQTAYALANSTGVPQPKVYETVRRLVERGAALRVAERPARYAAVPSTQLLRRLEESFRERLGSARAALERVAEGDGDRHEALVRFDGRDAVVERAAALVDAADRKVFLSGWEAELAAVAGPVAAAVERDVELVVLHFGDLPFELGRGCAYRHASSEGTLYRSHRARHLAVVADSEQVLWALAPGGSDWTALASSDPLVIAAVKDFVRHDVYVQKIYERLAPELHTLFGPGLELMTNLAVDAVFEPRPARRARRTHG